MENNYSEQERSNSLSKTTIKGFIVGVLTLFLIIPIPFILNLIEERQNSKNEVINEISNKWSGQQTIYGPFIEITHLEKNTDEKGKLIKVQKKTYISANELNIKGNVDTQVKKRSIYDAIIYNSKIDIKSKFNKYENILAESEIDPIDIIATKIVFGVSDPKGYENKIIVKSNARNYNLIADNQTFIDTSKKSNETDDNQYVVSKTESNIKKIQLLSQKIDPSTFDFNNVTINLSLKGSQFLNFIPSAIHTNVDLTTNWKDLKFDGNYLPNHDPIGKNGKTNVTWSIYQQNPLQGQIWSNASNFSDYSFGVNFLQMNDHYEKTYRSTKYAILFISLTFAAFFFIEIRNKFNIHIIQYALVGFAICVNFVLLLSLSEYISFNYSYLLSSSATIILISLFINSFMKSVSLTLKISLMLIFLYLFIFSILQLKEYALLVGSIGLFIIVAIFMYYSKNIEWNKLR